MLLAMIGLYGVISYMVARRHNEIGIRMSLGAGRASILALVLREAAVLLAVGLVIGIIVALATGNAAAAFLFGLKPTDVTTFVLATCGLAGARGVRQWRPSAKVKRHTETRSLGL